MPRPGPRETVGLLLHDHAVRVHSTTLLNRMAPLVGEHEGDGEAAVDPVEPGEEADVVPGDEVVLGAIERVALQQEVGQALAIANRHVRVRSVGVERADRLVGRAVVGRELGMPEALQVRDDGADGRVVRLDLPLSGPTDSPRRCGR